MFDLDRVATASRPPPPESQRTPRGAPEAHGLGGRETEKASDTGDSRHLCGPHLPFRLMPQIVTASLLLSDPVSVEFRIEIHFCV